MTQTPAELFGVSKGTWFEYEALRRSGVMNMWGSREALGLSGDEFEAIIRHYVEMADAWEAEFGSRGYEFRSGLAKAQELEGDDDE